jgi:parvulin-like peptidyl-prolyl isomerase
MKKWIPVLLVLLISLAACGPAKLEEGVVARVNDVNIPQEDFDKEIESFKKQYEAQGQFLTEADLDTVKPRLLDSLVIKQLLTEKAESLELEGDAESVQSQMDMFKQQFPSEEEFTASLESNGFSIESLSEELLWQSVLQELFEKEVASKIEISDEDAKAFFEENKNSYFTVPESVECSHILLMVNEEQSEEKALERITNIKNEIDNGLDFGDAAATFSEGPTRERRGQLGAISRGQTVPPFEEAAFSQEIGVVGEPVLTQFGYHLILVTAKNEETVTPYEEVAELIKQQLQQQGYEEGTMAYIEELRESAEIVLPEWATAEPEEAAVAAPAQS